MHLLISSSIQQSQLHFVFHYLLVHMMGFDVYIQEGQHYRFASEFKTIILGNEQSKSNHNMLENHK